MSTTTLSVSCTDAAGPADMPVSGVPFDTAAVIAASRDDVPCADEAGIAVGSTQCDPVSPPKPYAAEAFGPRETAAYFRRLGCTLEEFPAPAAPWCGTWALHMPQTIQDFDRIEEIWTWWARRAAGLLTHQARMESIADYFDAASEKERVVMRQWAIGAITWKPDACRFRRIDPIDPWDLPSGWMEAVAALPLDGCLAGAFMTASEVLARRDAVRLSSIIETFALESATAQRL